LFFFIAVCLIQTELWLIEYGLYVSKEKFKKLNKNIENKKTINLRGKCILPYSIYSKKSLK